MKNTQALPQRAEMSYTAIDGAIGTPHDAVEVYDVPVRYWHWLNAACIVTLAITGYLIGSPPASLSGEASSHFVFGYIRFSHFTAGLILTVAFFSRIIWAFVGNVNAKQLFLLPAFDKKWLHEVVFEIKWYLFLVPHPHKYVGHNPLAQFGMFFLFVLPMFFMVFTGLALYGEGLGAKSVLYLFTKMAFAVFGNSMTLHTFHHFGMWTIVVFAIIHIYTALREEVMSRQSMISAMTSGWRYFKNDEDD